MFASFLPSTAVGQITLIAGACIVLLAVICIFHRRLQEQNRRLSTALNNMSQGLNMFDAQGRILNKRYLQMYKLSLEVVKPSCTLKRLVEYRKETGLFRRRRRHLRQQNSRGDGDWKEPGARRESERWPDRARQERAVAGRRLGVNARRCHGAAARRRGARRNSRTRGTAGEYRKDQLSRSIAEISRQLTHTTNIVGLATREARDTDGEIGGLADGAQKIGDVVKLILLEHSTQRSRLRERARPEKVLPWSRRRSNLWRYKPPRRPKTSPIIFSPYRIQLRLRWKPSDRSPRACIKSTKIPRRSRLRLNSRIRRRTRFLATSPAPPRAPGTSCRCWATSRERQRKHGLGGSRSRRFGSCRPRRRRLAARG